MWLVTAFRAVELYARNLKKTDNARRILLHIMERYPKTPESMKADVWLWGVNIDGDSADRYYDIRMEEERFSEVNQRAVKKWIEQQQVTKTTLVLNNDTGKWDRLGDVEEFNTSWTEKA